MAEAQGITNKVYVPKDSAALSVGADEVAAAVLLESARRGVAVEVVRTGSRGLHWLEPLVELEFAGERHGFASAQPADAAAIIDMLGQGGAYHHPKVIGLVAQHPYLRGQTRVTFGRCGVVDPLNLDEYEQTGGLAGLRAALAMEPQQIVQEVTTSNLRGRGGAGFPAGIKWQTVLAQSAAPKYICCNADEGDSGTFADRMLLEGDPSTLIEGMVIAGLATGASSGYVYLRSEYPRAIEVFSLVLQRWRERGWLGQSVLGSSRPFDITLRRGAGAYICGEESSMLSSLEGKRGEVRVKPPIPAISGLFGKPTVVNNVLTFAAVASILAHGAQEYAALGVGRSAGTQAFQLAGNIKRGGLVEVPFGLTLRELIYEYGGGTASGRPLRAVQIGGPLGAYVSAGELDVAMTYEALAQIGAMLGHGGIVVFDDTVDMAHMAQFAMEFCAEESCGKCTPCRIGSVRGAETIGKIRRGEQVQSNIELLEDLCEIMTDGSLCAMGGLTPNPVLSALKHFREDFTATQDTATQGSS